MGAMNQAARRTTKIGVIGAGTAGLAASLALAQRGFEVTVLEKHPELAPLGAGMLIQPQGIRALTELGVADPFHAASVPVTLLKGTSHRGWTLVDIPYDAAEARGVSRMALSQVLLDAALAAGVHVKYERAVDKIVVQGHQAQLLGPNLDDEFDLVIIADGAASRLPAQVGLAAVSRVYKWGALWGMFDVENWAAETVLEQRYHGTEKMFGLMPTARVGKRMRLSLFWSLPCHRYQEWRQAPIEVWKDEMRKLWPNAEPVISQIVRHDQVAFATYRHARVKRLAAGPVCVIGDAAHSMSPQLGLGSTLAVQDALSLAQSVAQFGAVDGAAHYSKRRMLTVHAYQALSCTLTPCFQARGSALWRDLLFASSLKVPGMRRIMYRSIAS